MLLKALDALGIQQTVVKRGQEAPLDHSGTINVTNASQLALAANVNRSGFILQNNGAHAMYVNELGAVASATAGSFAVQPGTLFPPYGFPVSTYQVNILGTAGEAYTLREW